MIISCLLLANLALFANAQWSSAFAYFSQQLATNLLSNSKCNGELISYTGVPVNHSLVH